MADVSSTDPAAARAAAAQLGASQAQQAQGVARASNSKKLTEAEADRVARDFESMFLSQMLQPMFEKTSTGKGMFGGGHGEQMFSGLLVDEYAKQISKGQGLGVADMVRKEILRQQETAAPTGGAGAGSSAGTGTANAAAAQAAAKIAAASNPAPTTPSTKIEA